MYDPIWLFIGLAVAAIPAFLFVHYILERICFGHVKRYCKRQGIEITATRFSPEISESGVKTEKTIIEILSESEDKRIYRFVVWAFGIKHVSDKPYTQNEA
jgi:hypothetical protein